MDAASLPADLVLVGHVTGAYGIQGWVRIKPYSADASAMLHAKTWWLDKPDWHDVDMLQAKSHGGDVVASLMGVADRNAAEALRGTAVHIRRNHFPVLDKDEFYWIDLIGLPVDTLDGEALGTVADLMDNGAHPILRVVAADAGAQGNGKPQEWLIPFVDQFVKTVDQEGRRIVVDWGRDY